MNSIYNGRCYTIEFMKNVTQENPLEIILKFHTDEVRVPYQGGGAGGGAGGHLPHHFSQKTKEKSVE